MGIDLGWLLEEHAVVVSLPAGGRVQGPAGVLQREVELASVSRLLREPAVDVGGERELVEAAAEERGQLAFERAAVERFGLRRLDARPGAALDELALDRIQRRELVVPPGEGEDLVGDAEELRQEPLEVGREIEQQLRLGFRVQRLGVGTARAEPRGERTVGGFQEPDEMAVQPD